MKTFIIDDDTISIYLTRHILKVAGLPGEICTFLSAEEALHDIIRALPTNLPQLIFLDLNMPAMDGWEFLDALAPYKDHLLDHCRIYILTSSLDVSDTAKAKDYALVYGLIHKPIEQEDVQAILAELASST